MENSKTISLEELSKFGKTTTLSEQASALLLQQKENWDLVKENFEALSLVKTKNFGFKNFEIKVQFNPSRIKSTSAKVDKKSIENRKCFLCNENLPNTQKGIPYKENYLLLVNPYPIFKEHLTIPHIKHTPQEITSSLNDLLELSYDLKDNFFVFYNGPKCGASAPDHLHFQAGKKNSTPIEKHYKILKEKDGDLIFQNSNIEISAIDNDLTKFILLVSNKKESLKNYMLMLINEYKDFCKTEEEPLLNIFTFYDDNSWKVIMFLRVIHRPKEYFDEENPIMISPASADIAGLCITPREEDFVKADADILNNIFGQVLINKVNLEKFITILKNKLS